MLLRESRLQLNNVRYETAKTNRPTVCRFSKVIKKTFGYRNGYRISFDVNENNYSSDQTSITSKSRKHFDRLADFYCFTE